MYILKLKDINNDNNDVVGGKAANLGKLSSFGVRVPDGFCICFDAYREFVKINKLDSVIINHINRNLSGKISNYQCSQYIIKCFMEASIPLDIVQAIEKEYIYLNECRVAIRSSASTEDLKEASFAGQQDTFLNVVGIDNIIEHIKLCWASLWTERSMAYRKKTNYDSCSICLAVIIQEMIDSNVSGVAFTYNPINNRANEVLINSTYGLGEAVASGLVTPDTFIYDIHKKRIIYKGKGNKRFRFVNGTSGIEKVHNSIMQRQKYSINTLLVCRLVILCKKIEKHFNYPQDIEWAIVHHKIYILQSRPITNIEENIE